MVAQKAGLEAHTQLYDDRRALPASSSDIAREKNGLALSVHNGPGLRRVISMPISPYGDDMQIKFYLPEHRGVKSLATRSAGRRKRTVAVSVSQSVSS